MSLISSVINVFYCEERVLSKIQLKNDFGDYPPFPLRGDDLDLEFNIVNVRGVGVIYNLFNIFKKMLKESEQDTNLNPLLINGASDNTLIELNEVAKAFNELKNSKHKFVFVFAIAVVSPFVLIKMRKSKFFDTNCRGFYLPAIGSENQITARLGSGLMDPLAIISHEHLHFLQRMNNEFQGGGVNNLNFLNSEQANNERFKQLAQFMLYAFERNEVEARLHEIVLSYYRANRELPLTIGGFINLMATCNDFDDWVVSSLSSKEIFIPRDDVRFQVRDQKMAEQLKLMLCFFGDDDLRFRFVSEVLSVMYARLLMYYGDKKSSANFMGEISRPNLYDRMYAM